MCSRCIRFCDGEESTFGRDLQTGLCFFKKIFLLLFTWLFNLLEALISHVTELNDFVISYLYWRIISFVSDPTFSFLEKKYQSRMSCVIWNDEFDNNSTNVLICLPLSFFFLFLFDCSKKPSSQHWEFLLKRFQEESAYDFIIYDFVNNRGQGKLFRWAPLCRTRYSHERALIERLLVFLLFCLTKIFKHINF